MVRLVDLFIIKIPNSLHTKFAYEYQAFLILFIIQVVQDAVVTTSQPEALNDDPGTTPLADEAVTGEVVTQRARQEDQDEEDDDDDETSTVAPVTKAPIVAPQRNESTILNEFNFAGQLLNPADAKPQVAAVPQVAVVPPVVSASVPAVPVVPVAAVPNPATAVEEEDEATEAPASEQEKSGVHESEDKDSDNEITQDEVVTTYKPTNFEAEYQYTVQNFNKNKNRV